MNRRTFQALVVIAGWIACAAPLVAQDPTDSLTVEVLAADHLLGRHPGRPLHLDSAFATPGAAPGGRTSRQRSFDRHQALTGWLQADPSHAADPRAARMILSEPEFAGDSAVVTVTIGYDTGRRPRGGFYETVLVVLRRVGSAWRVERSVQLGIT